MIDIIKEIETDKVEGTLLGQRVSAPDRYTPEILVRVPRSENRDQYGIDNTTFTSGYDTWYAYECSSLTTNGVPIYFAMMIDYPSNSRYIVESKSLKLYLNSFNLEPQNRTVSDSINSFISTVKYDLEKLLECSVQINPMYIDGRCNLESELYGFEPLSTLVAFDNIEVNCYNESSSLLKKSNRISERAFSVSFDGFRSRCKITNAPDFARIYIRYEGKQGVDLESLVKYLSSFRNEDHFHEECVELIFKRLRDVYDPEYLWVRGNYTRRGGIDINPTRVYSSKVSYDFDKTRTLYQ